MTQTPATAVRTIQGLLGAFIAQNRTMQQTKCYWTNKPV